MPSWLATPLLLVGSNVLMTFAWYGHLKRPAWPLWVAILASWGIAFFEYCLAVPANRIGYGPFTGQQLKVIPAEASPEARQKRFWYALYLGEAPAQAFDGHVVEEHASRIKVLFPPPPP